MGKRKTLPPGQKQIARKPCPKCGKLYCNCPPDLVRIDCTVYFWYDMKLKFPSARFEPITRARIPGERIHRGPDPKTIVFPGNSPLSPSWELWRAWKDGIAWDDYVRAWNAEKEGDADYHKALNLLMQWLCDTKGQVPLYLLCFCRDPSRCHRALVKADLDYEWDAVKKIVMEADV